MANYYIMFSAVLVLKTKEQALEAVALAKMATDLRINNDEDDYHTKAIEIGFPHELVPYLEEWSFDCELDRGGELFGVWLHSEEHGDFVPAANFVRYLLSKYAPDDCFEFQWIHTCDKPRVDAYSGGAMFITAKEIKWLYTGEWLSVQRLDFEKIENK